MNAVNLQSFKHHIPLEFAAAEVLVYRVPNDLPLRIDREFDRRDSIVVPGGNPSMITWTSSGDR